MSAHNIALTLALVSISTALADITPLTTQFALCIFGASFGALLISWIADEVKPGGSHE